MLVGALTVLMIEPKFGLETSPTGWSKLGWLNRLKNCVIRLYLQGIELVFRGDAQAVIVRNGRGGYFRDGFEPRVGRGERQVAKLRRIIGVEPRVVARLMSAMVADVV
jgi:hypothetical protein